MPKNVPKFYLSSTAAYSKDWLLRAKHLKRILELLKIRIEKKPISNYLLVIPSDLILSLNDLLAEIIKEREQA